MRGQIPYELAEEWGMIKEPATTWHVFDGMDGQFYIRHRDGEFEDGPFISRAEAQERINEMERGRATSLVAQGLL